MSQKITDTNDQKSTSKSASRPVVSHEKDPPPGLIFWDTLYVDIKKYKQMRIYLFWFSFAQINTYLWIYEYFHELF